MATVPFKARTKHPNGSTNKWYRVSWAGGYCKSPVIEGNSSASNKRCNCSECKGQGPNGTNKSHSHISGSVLQNCKGYSTGRFMEAQSDESQGIIVKTNNIPSGDADEVWKKINNNHIYDTGSTPRVGAIVLWTNSGWGHWANVERVYSNTDVLLSESHWSVGINSSQQSKANFTDAWGYFGVWRGNPKTRFQSMKFLGYIYSPATFGEEQHETAQPSGTTNPPWDRSDASWINKNVYLNMDQMRNNALLAYSYLKAEGWSENACYALLGNMQQESTINPGLYERGGSGYGLVQWTPKTNYTNWAESNGYDIKDGDPQMKWIVEETVPTGQWIPTSTYNISFADWTTDTTHSLEWMTRAFERNFERSADSESIIRKRISYAEYWASWIPTQIIKIPSANIADPDYDMTDDQYPYLDNVADSQGDASVFSYKKPDNKHLLVARRRTPPTLY